LRPERDLENASAVTNEDQHGQNQVRGKRPTPEEYEENLNQIVNDYDYGPARSLNSNCDEQTEQEEPPAPPPTARATTKKPEAKKSRTPAPNDSSSDDDDNAYSPLTLINFTVEVPGGYIIKGLCSATDFVSAKETWCSKTGGIVNPLSPPVFAFRAADQPSNAKLELLITQADYTELVAKINEREEEIHILKRKGKAVPKSLKSMLPVFISRFSPGPEKNDANQVSFIYYVMCSLTNLKCKESETNRQGA
jgi:hypothetical protein